MPYGAELRKVGHVGFETDHQVSPRRSHAQAVISVPAADIQYRAPFQWCDQVLESGPLHVAAPLAVYLNAKQVEGPFAPGNEFLELFSQCRLFSGGKIAGLPDSDGALQLNPGRRVARQSSKMLAPSGPVSLLDSVKKRLGHKRQQGAQPGLPGIQQDFLKLRGAVVFAHGVHLTATSEAKLKH